MKTASCLLPLAVALVLCAPAPGQGRGDYFNVESPQVHPIDVARLDGMDYLLVANTPDSSVEIWQVDEALPASQRFVTRVRTGLEPVSVRWNPQLQRFYSANFLGDSITVVRLSHQGQALVATVEQTRYVGDEPVDIAFGRVPGVRTDTPQVGMGPTNAPPVGTPIDSSGGGSIPTNNEPVDSIDGRVGFEQALFVTHMSLHGLGIRNALTLDAVVPGASERIDLVDPTGPTLFGLKEPHAVATRGERLYVLGFKGGNTAAYDFDLFIGNALGAFRGAINGLGSTNWNLDIAPSGDVFVVGGEAQNHLDTEPVIAAAPTGFVKSTLYWIRGAAGPQPDVRRRDLNAVIDPLDPFEVVPQDSANQVTPVPTNAALAMPTDVAAYERDGQPTKVFVAAFGSDRVGVVEPQVGVASTLWPTRAVEITPMGSGNLVAGPRGLELRLPNPEALVDPGPRLYVMNRLDNSVTIIDPDTETVLDQFELQRDPTPLYVREGRPMMYSARLFSGNGFVSCASCHMDGRTDALEWNLGDPAAARDPFPLKLSNGLPRDSENDGDCDDVERAVFLDYVANGFPNKVEIITQSLQGLLNWEVEPEMDAFFTNAVYHWRGDRNSLGDFNPAFVGLLGMPPLPDTPAGEKPKGLTEEQITRFTAFVNSIHYPPNPQQPLDRVPSGDFGPLASADDISVGSGAMLGMKIYHVTPQSACDGRSCIQCHALPEGSDNRLTEITGGAQLFQPLETAALRGLFQKAKRLDKNSFEVGQVRIGEFGLTHRGGRSSVNGFNQLFSGTHGGLGPNGEFPPEIVALNDFVHELDWGTGPIVGRPLSVDKHNKFTGRVGATLDLFEAQAQLANCSLVVNAWIGGVERGFWYDQSGTTPAYREEPTQALRSRADLLAMLNGGHDLHVFQAVPLGDERRLARVGPSPLIIRPPPSDIQLRAMVPNSFYSKIPQMRKNWPEVPFEPGVSFEWTNPCAPTPRGPKGIRLMQYGLIQDAASESRFGFGNDLRHEAPRRFVVSGFDIQQGARLHLSMPAGNTPPDTSKSLEENSTKEFVLPIYPTSATEPGGQRVWQTAVELEPLALYSLLLGGKDAPGVLAAAFDTFDVIPEPPPVGFFEPLAWNWYYVKVVNPDQTTGDGGWQRLRTRSLAP